MDFEIQELTITLKADKLYWNIIGSTDETVNIYYRLYNDQKTVEEGNRTLPLYCLAILSQQPISITALNQILATEGITATKQILNENIPAQ